MCKLLAEERKSEKRSLPPTKITAEIGLMFVTSTVFHNTIIRRVRVTYSDIGLQIAS